MDPEKADHLSNAQVSAGIMNLRGKTALITGASRGIGKAIALRLAKEGVNIVIAAKTAEANPKLEGTIYSAAAEVEATGAKALPLICDIRFEDQIKNVIEKTVEIFGGIDILINNASAISLTSVLQTEEKRFDLMHDINVRGSFFMAKACIPYLQKSSHAHILSMSPPLDMDPKWFSRHLAYTISKFGMSMIVLGLAEELKKDKIGVNALWPKTTIATAAVKNILGGDYLIQKSRTPEIVADAAFQILIKSPEECNGNFFIDEDVLKQSGISNFDHYAVNPKEKLMTDLFIKKVD